jgi:hypothetical protein
MPTKKFGLFGKLLESGKKVYDIDDIKDEDFLRKIIVNKA